MIKMYFKGVCVLAILLLLVSGGAKAQTTHNITNTTANALEDFIKTGTWAAGDIIMLTSAGVYEVAATVDIPRSVTIKGDPALATRPVIRFTGTSGSFRTAIDNISITFSGVDFNGYQSNGTTRTPYIFRGFATAITDPAGGLATRFVKLEFENSRAWGFQGGIILNNNALRVLADEVILNNVEWFDMVGAYAVNLNQNGVKQLRVVNSTFYNIANGFINNPYFSSATSNPVRTEVIPQNIVIENNTFYKVAGAGGNTFIQMNDPKDQAVTLTFRNNVVSTLHTADNSRPFRIDPNAGTFTFSNNVFHNFTSTREEGIYNLAAVDAAQTNVTATNTNTGNPLFQDPDRGVFTLMPGSPARTAGANGAPAGDPQWAAGIHRIANTGPDALKTFIENTAGWAPGDIIILENAGNYVVNGTISIRQDVIIMGNPALATRPLITFHAGGFMPAAANLSIILKGFDINGKTLNDQGAEQRASILQYGRDNAFGARLIKIEEMHAYGLSNGVELFFNQGRTYESVIINNVIWHDITNWVFNPRINALIDARITNSTFYNAGGFMFNPYFSNSTRPAVIQQNILIDRNTFYNIGDGNRGILQINDSRDGSVNLTFTNNIVSTIKDAGNSRPFNVHQDAGRFTIRKNVVHNFNATDPAKTQFNLEAIAQLATVTAADNSTDAPGFANAAEGNFKLPNGTPLATAGTNGGLIGDPRWAPDNVTSLRPEVTAAKVEVYPNPVRDVLHINAASVVEVTIYNMSGAAVWKGTINRSGSIDIAAMKPGLYIARVDAGSSVQSLKILKQ